MMREEEVGLKSADRIHLFASNSEMTRFSGAMDPAMTDRLLSLKSAATPLHNFIVVLSPHFSPRISPTMASTAHGPRPETHGSRTMTVTPTTDSEAGPSTSSPPASREETPEVGVLRLRGGPTRRQRVMWTTDTVDNEGMGKKKSKSRSITAMFACCQANKQVCCIYHKPRRFDESSSESESGSDDDSCCHKDGPDAGSSQRVRPPSDSSHVVEQSSGSESEGGGGGGSARQVMQITFH